MGVPSIGVWEPVSLVERDEQLDMLFSLVDAGSGGTVVLCGEAGFGKTSLLRTFLADLDHRYTILEAACEPVGIPAAFSPLFDLLDELPSELRDEIRSGSGRTAVYAGMLDLLKSDRVVLVIEDLHWADEATLGLVRYLGRRIAPTKSLLIATYRAEEVDVTHPLGLVIADLGPSATRIDLPALTLAGVEQMTQGLAVDPIRIHDATLGNPFLVEEVIRHPDAKLPPTISNAVLARAAKFSPAALETLYAVALSPEGVSLDLLNALDPEAGRYVDLAVQRRLLVTSDGHVSCRHDLIRQSLKRAVPPALKQDLHRRILEHLEQQTDPEPDVSRLAYHSIGAHDFERTVAYSLEAGGKTARGGAHRQSAQHYANALRHRDRISPELLANVLLTAAHEHCLVNDFDIACQLAAELVELQPTPSAKGRARAWLSYFESRGNDLRAARSVAEEALATLQKESPSEEQALALAVIAWVSMVEGDLADGIDHATRAIEIARAAASPRVEVHAATTLGTCRVLQGDLSGRAIIEGAIRLGLENGGAEWTAKSMNNLAYSYAVSGDLPMARDLFSELVEFTAARELDAWYIAAVASRANLDVRLGGWDEADEDLSIVLGQRTCLQTEVEAMMTAANLAARRGEPGAEIMIENIIDRVRDSRDHDMISSCAVLGMEASWLGAIDIGQGLELYRKALELEGLAGDAWSRELAFWALRLGIDLPRGDISGPARLELDGRMLDAADAWDNGGYAIEAAISRALAPDADLDAAFASLAAQGADGVARGLRRELQRRGVNGVPRGERKSTKANPAGLTARQAEVLALMQAGMSNAAIAEKLYISEKTAGHHVSAILAKLNVSSRLQAVAVTTGEGNGRP